MCVFTKIEEWPRLWRPGRSSVAFCWDGPACGPETGDVYRRGGLPKKQLYLQDFTGIAACGQQSWCYVVFRGVTPRRKLWHLH